VNYFQINLNKLQDPEILRKQEKQDFSLFLMLGVFLITLAAAAVVQHLRLHSKKAQLLQTVLTLKHKIQELESSEKYVSEKDVRALEKLDGQRVFWANKLESLASIVGNRIALTTIRYSRGKLYIRGIARAEKTKNNFNLISDFIDRMKEQPYFTKDFKKIEFRSSQRIHFMNQDLLHFELLCR